MSEYMFKAFTDKLLHSLECAFSDALVSRVSRSRLSCSPPSDGCQLPFLLMMQNEREKNAKFEMTDVDVALLNSQSPAAEHIRNSNLKRRRRS